MLIFYKACGKMGMNRQKGLATNQEHGKEKIH
jgi:hypothetical protein